MDRQINFHFELESESDFERSARIVSVGDQWQPRNECNIPKFSFLYRVDNSLNQRLNSTVPIKYQPMTRAAVILAEQYIASFDSVFDERPEFCVQVTPLNNEFFVTLLEYGMDDQFQEAMAVGKTPAVGQVSVDKLLAQDYWRLKELQEFTSSAQKTYCLAQLKAVDTSVQNIRARVGLTDKSFTKPLEDKVVFETHDGWANFDYWSLVNDFILPSDIFHEDYKLPLAASLLGIDSALQEEIPGKGGVLTTDPIGDKTKMLYEVTIGVQTSPFQFHVHINPCEDTGSRKSYTTKHFEMDVRDPSSIKKI
ncbi:hypothetical protein HOI26_03570 [Candidatus Woesearchaeota archaeon]|jgi:hypothetical protein|nr:hypothetical protein [Candidatus Woesearchaeota archaeon]MBT5740155.1 hypothetical protein [Candidatus Woesearchaeota archaeon]